MYDRWYMIYYWYLIYDIWYSIFDIYFFSHILGGSFFLSPKLGGRWTDFCIPGRAGRLWWWGGWRGSASGEDTWAAPFRVTWMWYPGIVRSMNHGIFQVHVELIYIYIVFLGDSPKKDMVDFHQKKMNSSLVFHKLPELPDGCLCCSYICFFFHLRSVMEKEWPWFTKERRSRVFTFPADARRSLSQDWPIQPWIFGGFRWCKSQDHLQTTTFHTQGLRFCSHFIGGPTDLAVDSFLVFRNHRFGPQKSCFYIFFLIIFFLNSNSMVFFLITDLSACCRYIVS